MNLLLLIFHFCFPIGDALRLSTAPDSRLHPTRFTTTEESEDAQFENANTGDEDGFLLDFFLFDRSGNRIKSDSGMNLKKEQSSKDVDTNVWLHMSHPKQSLEHNHYSPLLATLYDAFSHINAVPRLVGQQHTAEMMEVLNKSGTLQHQTLISVGVNYASPAIIQATEQFSKMGVFVVLYQTEPGMPGVAKVQERAVRTGAKEIWDYSLANIAKYNITELAANNIKVRFVPPGYVEDLEGGVELNSPSRNENKIAFLGNWKGRSHELTSQYHNNLGEKLVLKKGVWTKEDFKEYLSTYPIQLDVHGQHGGLAMETFRLAPLATNKACIIAAPVPEDKEFWDDMVHHAQPNQTLEMYNSLKNDIKGCQLRTYEKFKEKMASAQILKNSGFLEVWESQ